MSVIDRYLRLATGSDPAALAACFTEEATVTDDGRTYRGRPEIQAWREELSVAFAYTATVLRAEPGDGGRQRLSVLLEGDFPGGRVELTYTFRLRGDLIDELVIG